MRVNTNGMSIRTCDFDKRKGCLSWQGCSPSYSAILKRMNVSRGHLSDFWWQDLNRAAAEKGANDEAHDCFPCLMELFKGEVGYEEESVRCICPFLLKDVQFNPILFQAKRDLAEIARVFGKEPYLHGQRTSGPRGS